MGPSLVNTVVVRIPGLTEFPLNLFVLVSLRVCLGARVLSYLLLGPLKCMVIPLMVARTMRQLVLRDLVRSLVVKLPLTMVVVFPRRRPFAGLMGTLLLL